MQQFVPGFGAGTFLAKAMKKKAAQVSPAQLLYVFLEVSIGAPPSRCMPVPFPSPIYISIYLNKLGRAAVIYGP